MTPCESKNTHPHRNAKKCAVWILPVAGFLSTLWMLLRIIPKPTRASYPCMKVAAPLASTFIAYLAGLAVTVFSFRKAKSAFQQKRFYLVSVFALLIVLSVGWMAFQPTQSTMAGQEADQLFEDPLGPNQPIGEAKGIFPGRVVWVHNPDATNENCTNKSVADAYFQEHNANQDVIDQMFAEGLLSLTGEATCADAWDAVFRYFNGQHEKGDVGYQEGETVFIKINAVTCWSGLGPNGGDPSSVEYDTSPHTILTMIRHLVNEAGVPQESIYVADPMCDLYDLLYNKFYAEFPNVNYASQLNVTGRYKLTKDTEIGIRYSDKGTVMTQVKYHRFFKEMMEADYLINIPAMKGHRWAGVTFFAKNHFGSNTADHSWELHKGLMKPDEDPLRTGYHLYRVLVDIMADKDLGGNTLLYFMDGLWATSYEHQPPQKFQTAPFNKDWSSSLLLSLDPVAIESVCLEILQKEFREQDDSVDPTRHAYVQWEGIDDYLHQAASSEWWPEGITYDPDETGSPIPSLGVHEHWNNEEDMQYSRNLGTGDGIELIKIFQPTHVEQPDGMAENYRLSEACPNPFNPKTHIRYELGDNAFVTLEVFNIHGQKIRTLVNSRQPAGTHVAVWNGRNSAGLGVPSGMYLYRFRILGNGFSDVRRGQMVLLK